MYFGWIRAIRYAGLMNTADLITGVGTKTFGGSIPPTATNTGAELVDELEEEVGADSLQFSMQQILDAEFCREFAESRDFLQHFIIDIFPRSALGRGMPESVPPQMAIRKINDVSHLVILQTILSRGLFVNRKLVFDPNREAAPVLKRKSPMRSPLRIGLKIGCDILVPQPNSHKVFKNPRSAIPIR